MQPKLYQKVVDGYKNHVADVQHAKSNLAYCILAAI